MYSDLPLWGAIGETAVEAQFAAFHRTRLQRCVGTRAPAKAILAAYTAWAETSGAGAISFRELKRLMVRAGHRHFYSNGALYADVIVLSDGAAIVMDAARERSDRLARAAIIERIDRVMNELVDLRQLLAEARP